MCGIAGYVGLEDRELLRRMCAVLAHRGPDGEGQYHGARIGLGNRRLAIVDVAGGHQPLSNEDGTIWVTFNGEIYNHGELRTELESAGHRFRTRCDTEAIVHAYEAWGDECVERLNGIFAFALWDTRRERLLLARDAVGVKPLHYTKVGDAFLFASEIKALFQHPALPREVNPRALFLLMSQFYIPGEETLFQGIHRVLPGHLLVYERGMLTSRPYWEPDPSPLSGSETEMVALVRESLEQSLRGELQGEVPMGLMLSAGMDSTTLLALTRKHREEPLHTYTVSFGAGDDEASGARQVASRFGSIHHEITYDSQKGLETLPRLLWQMEEPRMQLGPTFQLAREARREVKVLFTGIGGDELFLGYPRDLRLIRLARIPPAVPTLLRRIVGGLPAPADRLERARNFLASGNDAARLYESFAPTGPLTRRETMALLGDGISAPWRTPVAEAYRPYFERARGHSFVDQALAVGLRTYLAEDVLAVADRMLAAHGLEGRVPFCNRRLVELAFRIPVEMRAQRQKHLLREAMRQILPQEIVGDMRKMVFGAPLWHWFEHGFRELASRILTRRRVEQLGYFRSAWIERQLGLPANASRERAYCHLWHMATFDLWHRIFIEGDPARPELDLEALLRSSEAPGAPRVRREGS